MRPTGPWKRSWRPETRSPAQLELRECNSSIYVFRTDVLWPALDRLEPHNAQGELYLTDAVRDLVGRGESGSWRTSPPTRPRRKE